MSAPQRLVIAITGATGVIYGVRLLQVLRGIPGIETHLLVSEAGVLNLHQELDLKRKDVEALINACDAGREGELIFRHIVQHAKSKLPVRRLWLQSMTPAAIRDLALLLQTADAWLQSCASLHRFGAMNE